MRNAVVLSIVVFVGCGQEGKQTSALVDPARSSITVDRRTGIVADLADAALLSIEARDASGRPLAQRSVRIVGHAVFDNTNATSPLAPGMHMFATQTDKAGKLQLPIRSSEAGPTFLLASVEGVDLAPISLDFVAGPPARLQFLGLTELSVQAGQPVTPPVRVALRDKFGNLTNAPGQITLTVTEGSGLTGNTSTPALNGIATFGDLSFDLVADQYNLVAFIGGAVNVANLPVSVSPGPPAAITFEVQPHDARAGDSLAVDVALRDRVGNLRDDTNPITLTLTNGAVLGGNLKRSPDRGIAHFTGLSVTAAATSYRLHASAAGYGAAESAPFAIAPGSSHTLRFSGQPSAVASTGIRMPAALSTIAPAVLVEVRDYFGNLATDAGETVTLTAYGASGVQLLGTTARVPQGGVVRFDDLQLTRGGHSLLSATSTSASASSRSFDVAHTVVVGPGGSNTFSPSALTLSAGDTVQWYWASDGQDVVSGSGGVADGIFCSLSNQACDTAPLFNIGQTYRYTFVAPGGFSYFSRGGPSSMVGTLSID